MTKLAENPGMDQEAQCISEVRASLSRPVESKESIEFELEQEVWLYDKRFQKKGKQSYVKGKVVNFLKSKITQGKQAIVRYKDGKKHVVYLETLIEWQKRGESQNASNNQQALISEINPPAPPASAPHQSPPGTP